MSTEKTPSERYPECEKQRKIVKESQAIGEFLDWLQSERKIHLCTDCKDDWGDDRLTHAGVPIYKLLAEYFDIDLNKVDEEKRQMLDELREANKDSRSQCLECGARGHHFEGCSEPKGDNKSE